MIEPVKFETAKLIHTIELVNSKYKFGHIGYNYYNHLGELNGDMTDFIKATIRKEPKDIIQKLESIPAPSIADVVMSIYYNNSLWILVLPTVTGHFAYKIIDVQLDPENPIERPPYNGVSAYDYNTPSEAYENAILEIMKFN